jgi:hypothetical protein
MQSKQGSDGAWIGKHIKSDIGKNIVFLMNARRTLKNF